MATSPSWATWSLQSKSSDTIKLPERSKSQRVPVDDNAVATISLFSKSAQDDIYQSTWHDYKDEDEDGESESEDGGDVERPNFANNPSKTISAQPITEVTDLDKLFPEQEEQMSNAVKAEEMEHFESGFYRFDPLTPVESRALRRALKLSAYIPPSAQEKEEERQLLSSMRVIPFSSADNWENTRSRGTRINEETGKRVYNVTTRATGICKKENTKAREVLQAMCKTMLPRRHPEWVLAQLTYHRSNMIGFDDLPSSRGLLLNEAIENVQNQTMEMHDLAHVTRLLAEASKVDTSAYDIIDPTRSARQRGRPATAVKNKMVMQSQAVYESLKLTFPALFCEDVEAVESGVQKYKVIAKTKRETTVEGTPSMPQVMQAVRKADSSTQKGDHTAKSTEGDGQNKKRNWTSIFPTLRLMKETSSRDCDLPSNSTPDAGGSQGTPKEEKRASKKVRVSKTAEAMPEDETDM